MLANANLLCIMNRAKVIFGLNALSGRTLGADGSAVGAWNYSNAEFLIRYTVNKGYSIYGWELGKNLRFLVLSANSYNAVNYDKEITYTPAKIGNELSGNGIGTRIAADQYATDTISLQNVVQGVYKGFQVKPVVLGPGGFFAANWFSEFVGKAANSLQVITHHIYNLGPGIFLNRPSTPTPTPLFSLFSCLSN